MDSLIIRLFHKTCALSFTEGWTCGTEAYTFRNCVRLTERCIVSEINANGSPFDSYIMFSLGYIVGRYNTVRYRS
jgi:hypothetical protein